MKKTMTIFFLIMFVWGCAHAPDTAQINEKVNAYDDVDGFVAWLKTQPGVKDVKAGKNLFLTTHPPQIVVSYSQNGRNKKLLIAIEPDKKLRFVKPKP